MSNTTNIFTDLPTELISIIFSNLKIIDATNLGRVNKNVRKIYLNLVNQTKCIYYNRKRPNSEMARYIKTILQNICMGNRMVILNICPDKDTLPATPHPSPIFKIVNLSIKCHHYGLKLYLMNKENIRIIYFNIIDNNITCDVVKENNDLLLKFIINTPFNAKMRPLNYTFENNKIKRQ